MLKFLTLSVALLASTSLAFAQAPKVVNPTQDSQAPQVGGPSIREVFRPPSRVYAPQVAYPVQSDMANTLGGLFNPTSVVRQCAAMAGASDYTVSVKNTADGFSATCKLEVRKPE